MAGQLVAWGGPLPELPEIGGETNTIYSMPDLHWLEMLGFAQVDPHFRSNSPFIKPPAPPNCAQAPDPAQRRRPSPISMKAMTGHTPAGLAIALALLLAAGTPALAGDTSSDTSTDTSGATDGGTFYSPLPAKVQEDLGDIRPAATGGILSYFHGQASVNTEYISNAALYHSRDEADFMILPDLQGGFTVPLNKNFKLELDARLEDYTYSSQQKLGFWGVSGNADLEYRYKPTWPRFYAGVEPYYYLSYETGTGSPPQSAPSPAWTRPCPSTAARRSSSPDITSVNITPCRGTITHRPTPTIPGNRTR